MKRLLMLFTMLFMISSVSAELYYGTNYFNDDFNDGIVNSVYWYNETINSGIVRENNINGGYYEANTSVVIFGDAGALVKNLLNLNDGLWHIINFTINGTVYNFTFRSGIYLDFNNGSNFYDGCGAGVGSWCYPDTNGQTINVFNQYSINGSPQEFKLYKIPNGTVYFYNSTSLIETKQLDTTKDMYFQLRNFMFIGQTATIDFKLYNYTDYKFINTTSEAWINSTIEGSSSLFNITLNTGGTRQISEAILVYNNTEYTGTINNLGGGNYYLSTTITTPRVNVNKNISFYWNVTLDNGVSYILPTRNQSLSNFDLDICGTNTVLIYNFTLKDEDEQTFLTGSTYNTSIEVELHLYPLSSQTSIYDFYQNYTKVNPARICITSNVLDSASYRVYGTVKYSSQDRVIEYYNIQNSTLSISTIPYNINLYDLLITSSQEFLITYKDSNFIPQSDVVIELQRKYIDEGLFKVVEAPLTDADGKTIGHFVLSDEIYNIYVKKNNIRLATFENVRPFCSNIATGDCTLTLTELSSTTAPNSFTSPLGVRYWVGYNQTSRTMTVIYQTVDNSIKTLQLNITLNDIYQNTSICSSSLTSSTGTVSCIIPSTYNNNTVLAKGYIDGELLFTTSFDVTIDKSDFLNPTRYILAILLIMIIIGMVISYGIPELVLVGYVMGLILSASLFLLSDGDLFGSFSSITWIIVATVILIVGISMWRNR